MAIGWQCHLQGGEARLREGRMVVSTDNREPRTKTGDKKPNRRHEVRNIPEVGL